MDTDHPDRMPVAYSYIRMSRPEQLRGDSLRRQLEAARKWAVGRGIELDEGLRDIGVSAYRGKNRTEGALGAFLSMVEDGRVARGSYLVMESLDRLSREAVVEALPRFMDIVNAGVTIVTLIDGQEYSKARLADDWTPLLMSLAVMARAHDESRTKAKRVREAWEAKRATASEKVLTRRVPAWLRVVDGRIEEIPKHVELVQRIFRETIAGDGRRAIVMRLNGKDGPPVPPFLGGRGWQPSYIAKILSNRSVLGEYQAFGRDEKGGRRPVGDPIPGYYPRIVGEDEFHLANQARKSRAQAPGPRGEAVTNIFLGLAKCSGCGASMVIRNRGAAYGGRALVCADADRGAGCDNRRHWGLAKLEAAVLQEMRRADLPSPTREKSSSGDEVAAIEGQIEDVRRRRERLLDLVEAGDDGAAARVQGLSKTLADLQVALGKARLAARVDAAIPSYREQLLRVRQLGEALATAQGEDLREIRTRLAQTLRETLISVDCGPLTVTCRMRRDRIRFDIGVSQGSFPEGVPVVTIDERPRVMTELERFLHEPEPGELERIAAETEEFIRAMQGLGGLARA